MASLTNQTQVTLGETGSSSLGPISEYGSTQELWSLPGPVLAVHRSEFPVRGTAGFCSQTSLMPRWAEQWGALC